MWSGCVDAAGGKNLTQCRNPDAAIFSPTAKCQALRWRVLVRSVLFVCFA